MRAVWHAAETDGQFICVAFRCNPVYFVQVYRPPTDIKVNGFETGDTLGYVFRGVTLSCVYRHCKERVSND